MLVLSRRPKEKILFPNLGISVEIIQTKGNTVRVGIEAPEDVRVLRGELEQREAGNGIRRKLSISNRADCDSFDVADKCRVEQQIDEIGIALALAQNQQRQGLSDHVDIALEQALDRLNDLKQSLEKTNPKDTVVCESSPKYETQHTKQLDAVLEIGDALRNFRMEFEMAI